MTVGIVEAGTDKGDSWLKSGQEGGGRRRPAAVVSHLEHIDRAARGQAFAQYLRVDLLFHVAGEEHPPVVETDVQHDRDVVDATPLVRRHDRHFTGARPEDADVHAVEIQ